MDVRALERALDEVAIAREERRLPWLLAGAGLLSRREAEDAARGAESDLDRALRDVAKWRAAMERESGEDARAWSAH